jgi:hypothetical protein
MTEDSAPLLGASAAGTDHIDPDHLRKEGWTMALYVAICLIAALTALANVTAVPGHIMGLVWGHHSRSGGGARVRVPHCWSSRP